MSVKDRTSSDPFVRIYLDDGGQTTATTSDYFDDDKNCLFQSRSKSKTVNPKFNETFRHTLRDPDLVNRITASANDEIPCCWFVLKLFDEDGMHGEDAMGQVRIPIVIRNDDDDDDDATRYQWYAVEEGGQGELQVKLQVTLVRDE